ncbi:MAG: hypothetical protein ACLT38_00190 [Akkermansia sp.]
MIILLRIPAWRRAPAAGGDEVWFSRVTESPDALCYNVNIDKPGVYRVDAFSLTALMMFQTGIPAPCAVCT